MKNRLNIYIVIILFAMLQGCGIFKSASQKEKAKSDKAHAYMALHPEEFATDCNRYFKPVESDIVTDEYVSGAPIIDTNDTTFDISGLIANAINSMMPNLQDSIKRRLLDSLAKYPQQLTLKSINKKQVDTLKSLHNKTVINTAEVEQWKQLYNKVHDSAIANAALYEDAKKRDSTAYYKKQYADQVKKYNSGKTKLKWSGIGLFALFVLLPFIIKVIKIFK